MAKHWQAVCVQNLTVPDQRYVGAFRGEPGLENIGVKIGLILASSLQELHRNSVDLKPVFVRASPNWTRRFP